MKLVIIIGIAVLILTAIFVAMQCRSVEKMENGNGGQKTARFFSMEGCPHCVTFDSEWKAFAGMSKVSAEKHVYYRNEVGSKKNDEYVKQSVMGDESVVSSFPTVLFIDEDGNYVKYDGDRTAEGLKKGWDKWKANQN